MASLPPSFAAGADPARLLHPNAPAAGCGFGNSRVPGSLCGTASPHAQAHVDAPAHQGAWYDAILGVFPHRVMAVYQAITGAHRYLARALIDATGMELHDVLAGILPSLLIMVAVLALSTTIGAAAGAALGALAGGVGAIPGAAAGATVGLEAGTALLEWLGLAFLVVYIGKSLLAGTRLAATAVGRAWHSVDQSPAMREVSVVTASHELATAVALVFRGVLQGVVAFLLAKGTAAAASRVPELVAGLRKSRLGGSFASWVERNWAALVENPKLKDAPPAIVWPPNRGFAGTPTTETLTPGMRVDRYGYDAGTFVAPEGTPIPARSLAPGTIDKPYNIYEVVKPIDAEAGPAAPWFGEPGGGIQYELPTSVKDAIANGSLRRVGP